MLLLPSFGASIYIPSGVELLPASTVAECFSCKNSMATVKTQVDFMESLFLHSFRVIEGSDVVCLLGNEG